MYAFKVLAEEKGFILVAPDSSNPNGWGGDLEHIQVPDSCRLRPNLQRWAGLVQVNGVYTPCMQLSCT